MLIQTYTAVQLQQFMANKGFGAMAVLPISKLRAQSHIHNPRVRPDDIIMLIAFDGNNMIGYLGVLADNIYNSKGGEFHSGWLSTLWVSPTMRGKGVANQLLAKAYESWNEQILVTEFTTEAKGLYNRSGYFTNLRIRNGLRCFLRFNLHEVLPPKAEKYAKYRGTLKLADSFANVPVALAQAVLPTPATGGFVFEPVTRTDAELNTWLTSTIKNSFEKRGPAEFDWMVIYPWVEQGMPTEESRHYHFTCVANRFENRRYRVKDAQGKIKGFLHFTICNNHLKIPYAYFESDASLAVVSFIKKLMLTEKLNMLTVFHPAIVFYLKEHRWPFIYLRPATRNYIITKKLYERTGDLSGLQMQDGDADAAFT